MSATLTITRQGNGEALVVMPDQIACIVQIYRAMSPAVLVASRLGVSAQYKPGVKQLIYGLA